jgi:glycerophosphoryl diester phosphodiesterase
MPIPLLLGHRGLRVPDLAPENTFAAFDLAVEHGCDGFEFDVRRTGWGGALVCHDPRIGKVLVARSTRRQLTKVPRLSEVLSRYAHRVFLDIELKVRGLESTVLSALRDTPPTRDFVVSSFIPDVVTELVARSAKAPTGIICDKLPQLRRWALLPVQYIIAEKSLVRRDLIEEIHAAHRKLFVWTVNDPRSMQRFAELGVDAIVSDDTQLLVKTLRT